MKQRDNLLYILIGVSVAFTMKITHPDFVDIAIFDYIKKIDDALIDLISLSTYILWFLFASISIKYYHMVVIIEGQYDYMHALEGMLNKHYRGTKAFTREGKSYNECYPLFKSWIHIIYKMMIPAFFTIVTTIKIYEEYHAFSKASQFAPSLACYIIISISTILYLLRIHFKR